MYLPTGIAKWGWEEVWGRGHGGLRWWQQGGNEAAKRKTKERWDGGK